MRVSKSRRALALVTGAGLVATLVVVTGTAAYAAPTNVSAVSDLSLGGCPVGTTEFADANFAGPGPVQLISTTTGLPLVGSSQPTSVTVNAGGISFSGAKVPIAAVAVTGLTTAGVAVASGRATWDPPTTADSTGPLITQVLAKVAGAASPLVNIRFCSAALSSVPVVPDATGSLALGNVAPGRVGELQTLSITNPSGVAQSVTVDNTQAGLVLQAAGVGACAAVPTFVLATGSTCTIGVTLEPAKAAQTGPVNATLQVTYTPLSGSTPLTDLAFTDLVDANGTVVDTTTDPVYLSTGTVSFGSRMPGSALPFAPVTVVNADTVSAQTVTIESTALNSFLSAFALDSSAGGAPVCDATGALTFQVAAGSSCIVGVRPDPALDPSALRSLVGLGGGVVTTDLHLVLSGVPGTAVTHVGWAPLPGQIYVTPRPVAQTSPPGTGVTVPLGFGYVGPATGPGVPGPDPTNVNVSITGPDAAAFTATPCAAFTTWSCPVTVTADLPVGATLSATVTLSATDSAGTPLSASTDVVLTAVRPTNDDIAAATTLTLPAVPDAGTTTVNVAVAGDSTGATTQAGEPLAVNQTLVPTNFTQGTLWYKVKAPFTGLLRASAANADSTLYYDASLYYDNGGVPGDLASLSGPLFNGGGSRVYKDQSYWIQLGAHSAPTGPFQLYVSEDQVVASQSVADISTATTQPYFPTGSAVLGSREQTADAGETLLSPVQVTVQQPTDVRVEVLATDDHGYYDPIQPTVSVFELPLSATPHASVPGSAVPMVPVVPDPLVALPPLDPFATFATYHFLPGHTYVVQTTNGAANPVWLAESFEVTGASIHTPPPTPPTFSGVPGPVVVTATGPTGAVATYTPPPTATKQDGSPATVTCLPASGSTFAVGVTTVTCTAADPGNGTSATVSFTVTVAAVAPPTGPVVISQTAYGTAAGTTVAVTWAAPAWDGGSAISGYTVTASAGGTILTHTLVSPVTSDSFAFPVLPFGTPVTVTVTARTTVGDSPVTTVNGQVLPFGVQDAGVGTGVAPSATSSVTIGASTYTYGAAGTGTGTVVVSHYGGSTSPTGVTLHGTSSPYFDVFVAPGSSLTQVAITSCPASTGGVLSWFDPSVNAWTPVRPAASLTTVGTATCLRFVATALTSPSIFQLTGTVFGVVDPPASGTVTAAAHDVPTGGSTTVAVHVDTATAGPAENALVTLAPGGQTATTDAAGNAAFTVTSAVAGTATYSATANGISIASDAVTYWDAPTATTSSLAVGTVGSAYAATAAAIGGKGPLTWSATGLPAALTIAPATGAITGTPTATSSSTVTLTATDSLGQKGSVTLTLTIESMVAITTTSLPDVASGAAYAGAVNASGGSTPYAWTATGLPSGLTIDPSTGAIGGSTTVAGPVSVTVRVVDAAGRIATKALTFTVYAAPVVTTSTLPVATVGSTYSTTLAATGGKAPLTWTVTGLPAGLTATAAGVVSGTPTASGAFVVSVSAADALGQVSSTVVLTLTVNPATPPSGSDIGVAVASGSFTSGESTWLRVKVSSTGSAAVPGPVTATISLPAGVVASSVSGTGWRCTAAAAGTGQKVTCSSASGLGVGRSTTFTLTVRVRAAAGTRLSIDTTVGFAGTDPTPADNTTTTTAVVRRH